MSASHVGPPTDAPRPAAGLTTALAIDPSAADPDGLAQTLPQLTPDQIAALWANGALGKAGREHLTHAAIDRLLEARDDQPALHAVLATARRASAGPWMTATQRAQVHAQLTAQGAQPTLPLLALMSGPLPSRDAAVAPRPWGTSTDPLRVALDDPVFRTFLYLTHASAIRADEWAAALNEMLEPDAPNHALRRLAARALWTHRPADVPGDVLKRALRRSLQLPDRAVRETALRAMASAVALPAAGSMKRADGSTREDPSDPDATRPARPRRSGDRRA